MGFGARDIQQCSFTAGLDRAIILGVLFDPATIVTDLPGSDDAPTARSIGATLEGPGVSRSWRRNANIREVVDVVGGGEYTLTIDTVGIVLANPAINDEDGSVAIALADVRAPMSIGIVTDPDEVIEDGDPQADDAVGCIFHTDVYKNPPGGIDAIDNTNPPENSVHYRAGVRCLAPTVVQRADATLYRGSGQYLEGVTPPGFCYLCPPVVEEKAAGNYDCGQTPTGSCWNFFKVVGEYQVDLVEGAVWVVFDPRCSTSPATTHILQCTYPVTKGV